MDLNEEEKQLCKELRDRVVDLKIGDPYRVMDFHMIRFLRARGMDIEKAEDMFRKYIAWRLENNVDNACSWEIAQDLKESTPYKVVGHSLNGGLVVYAHVGSWNPLVAHGRYEELMKLAYHELEYLTQFHKYFTLQKNYFSKMVLIINLEGLSFAHVSTVDYIRALISLLKAFEAYYPESLKVAFLINAPWVFSILWSIAKPFISTATHERLRFLGADRETWKEEIQQYIAEDQYPECIGGTLKDNFELVYEDGKVVGKFITEPETNDNECKDELPAAVPESVDMLD
ncbi:SEC14-like protein 2 [Orchesella cincta]|uniref:SEC14-like protein 2 n=1 Tax=Orchesella cincta TaxID=48709 RepID=A0A1D2NAK1_ORCCI|nr:SEC14-like protein 2 [Orchesella cincta]